MQALRFSYDCRDKLLADIFVDVTALNRRTRLAAVRKRAPDGRARGVLDIRIIKHDHWIFAAQFEDDRYQVLRRGFGDALAGSDAAGEHDLIRPSGYQRGARRSVAGNNLQDPFGQSSARHDFLNLQTRK